MGAISSTVLHIVRAAIRRFEGVDYDPSRGLDSGEIRAQEEELALCMCNECTDVRGKHADRW